MKLVKIDEKTFDDFVAACPYSSYFQTSSYGFMMSKLGLKDEYYGFKKGNQLVGVTLILIKNSFMSFKYGYCPRGIIIDFTQEAEIKEAAKVLKSTLFKERFLLIKIDPLVVATIRDKKGNIASQNTEFNNFMNWMGSAGFSHCGFNLYFESVKPRFEFEMPIDMPATTLFKNLSKQVRNKLRKATKYGVTVYKDSNPDFQKIFPFVKDKGLNYKYYEEMKQAFGDDFEVFYAKLNTRIYVENSKRLYEKELEINHYLTNIIQSHGYKGKKVNKVLSKKLESDKLLNIFKNYMVAATALLRDHPDGLIVGVTLTLKYLDKIYLISEGYDKNNANLASNYLTKWKIIEKYADSEYKIFNMNGVSGKFTKESPYRGLNEMKTGYNGRIIEYAGEFNLIINQPMYSLSKGINLNKK